MRGGFACVAVLLLSCACRAGGAAFGKREGDVTALHDVHSEDTAVVRRRRRVTAKQPQQAPEVGLQKQQPQNRQQCHAIYTANPTTKIGFSWGTMSGGTQRRWTKLGCDRYSSYLRKSRWQSTTRTCHGGAAALPTKKVLSRSFLASDGGNTTARMAAQQACATDVYSQGLAAPPISFDAVRMLDRLLAFWARFALQHDVGDDWALDFGSAVAAHRHPDCFIPWDNDMDITVGVRTALLLAEHGLDARDLRSLGDWKPHEVRLVCNNPTATPGCHVCNVQFMCSGAPYTKGTPADHHTLPCAFCQPLCRLIFADSTGKPSKHFLDIFGNAENRTLITSSNDPVADTRGGPGVLFPLPASGPTATVPVVFRGVAARAFPTAYLARIYNAGSAADLLRPPTGGFAATTARDWRSPD